MIQETADLPFDNSTYGIDISQYNNYTSYDQIVNTMHHDRKLGAVFMRGSKAANYTDPTYLFNAAAFSTYPDVEFRATYHHHVTSVSGREQAEYVAQMLAANPYFIRQTDYYVIDVEDDDASVSKEQYAHNIIEFIATMESYHYTNSMIYVTANFWNDHVGEEAYGLFNKTKLWLARWGDNNGEIPEGEKWYTELPNGAEKASVWQFTSRGNIDGMDGDCDLDLISKDLLN